MEMPALLPEMMKPLSRIEDTNTLLVRLTEKPTDFVLFFEHACGDETWSEKHQDFIRAAIQWLTEQFLEDKLSIELAQRASHAIQNHYSILEPSIPRNIAFQFNASEVPSNSLLWGASGEFFHTLLRQECRDQGKTVVVLGGVEGEVFIQIEEFIQTGKVEKLWRKEYAEIIQLLKQAAEWKLSELMGLCEETLIRYLTKGNAIDQLLLAHEEGWPKLREACMEFINRLDVGVHFENTDLSQLAFEFLSFREEALTIFESVRFHITHLACGHTLIEEPSFTEVINRCPKLVCLDISRSSFFSDRLLDIPEKLQELNLSQCTWANSKNLRQLFQICPRLTKVVLASNTQLDYLGWSALKELKYLIKLDISRCHQVTDQDFKIILQACRNATQFSLMGCTGLTDQAFYEMGKGFPKLTDLDISRCLISDPALIDLSVHCKQLVTLNLTRCTTLTEKGVVEAVRNAPALQLLNLSMCRLPESTIQKIVALRPFLKVIL